jgi:hypothetical protein
MISAWSAAGTLYSIFRITAIRIGTITTAATTAIRTGLKATPP